MREHIDGCVILELVMESKRNKAQKLLQQKCRQYFYRITKTRNGLISLPALGEVFKAIYFIEDNYEKHNVFNKILDLIQTASITFTSPTKETYKIVNRIIHFDTHIEAADALRIAEAKTEDVALITLDKKLIENIRLQEKFNITIKAPYQN
jgi:predicted nucleic acid-binding protein